MNTIEYVINNNNDLEIDLSIIPDIIKNIKDKKYNHWSNKFPIFKKMNEKELILFSFIVESINFCFWPRYEWLIKEGNKTYLGSDVLLLTIIKAIKNNKIVLDESELHKVTKDQFYEIITQNDTTPILMEERYSSFKETFNTIYNKKDFWEELFSIKSDTKLEEFLTDNFNNFKDISEFKGKEIKFNKRCRLLIGDLFYTSPTIRNNVKNINNIKGCADYSLPRYFREIGLFKYSKDLADKIDHGEEIKHNSEYEVIIRATTLYVLEKIKEELKEQGKIINTIELDNIIWNLSRKDKKTSPHHTISIYY